MSVCRDPKTSGRWQVVQDICRPSQVAEAAVENAAKAEVKKRGLILSTRLGK